MHLKLMRVRLSEMGRGAGASKKRGAVGLAREGWEEDDRRQQKREGISNVSKREEEAYK